MLYVSTRGNSRPVSAAAAIRLGMVPLGGLFVPDAIPEVDIAMLPHGYQALAAKILSVFLTDYSPDELEKFAAQAYQADRFADPRITPLVHLDDTTSVLELWHGPTAAFKDVALQMLPHLLTAAIAKEDGGREVVILVATSGDTGKAALEGFRDVPGTRIIVFYPKNGVSRMQEAQMLTTGGSNTTVIGVEGNFDDCQTMVKELFADRALGERLSRAGFEFSSANSINWGRLVPQIVYYFHAYFALVDEGRLESGAPCNFAVPTGNFGNILAAYYARRMGLPVGRLICASNKNRILTDFFATGSYDRNRDFHRTSSPSMDILISSNLERFLYDVSGFDGARIAAWYGQLSTTGKFSIDGETLDRIHGFLSAGAADEAAVQNEIRRAFREHGYLMDTHTAVASHVAREYRQRTGDRTPLVIDSTASAFKFNQSVHEALTGEGRTDDEFVLLEALQEYSGVPIHRSLRGLDALPLKHDRVMKISDGREVIAGLLGLE